jgi:hypothetical protein
MEHPGNREKNGAVALREDYSVVLPGCGDGLIHSEELNIPVLIQAKKVWRKGEKTGCCSTCFINASLSWSGRVK